MPKTIGRFQINGFYAQGGLSMLYLATDPNTTEQLIVKVLHPKCIENREYAQEFLNEATTLSTIKHPNIVHLYEYGTWENGLYIAMELIQGQSLRQILQHAPLPLKRAIDVLIQIGKALFFLHKMGIIHRDIKPENVIIDTHGHVKLIDFGLSKKILINRTADPCSNSSRGTPTYMSPEIRADPTQYSIQSDLYALGILAYELVLGKITHGKVIIGLAPKGVQKILQTLLKTDPKERYPSVLELNRDLCSYANSGEIVHDRQGADYFFELYEQLDGSFQKMVESNFLSDAKQWDIGSASSFGIGMEGLYHSHIESSSSFNLLIYSLKTRSEGAKAIFDLFKIDAIQKTLQHISSSFEQASYEWMLLLLHEIQRQEIELTEIAILLLDRGNLKYTWITSKWGSLLFLAQQTRTTRTAAPSQDIFIEEYTSLNLKREEGFFSDNEEIILACYTSSQIADSQEKLNNNFENEISKIALESSMVTPQKKAENILRTLRLHHERILEGSPAFFTSIQRKTIPIFMKK
ncbi:MAG: serine/threonine-protein kinase [Chlamydia sp.]